MQRKESINRINIATQRRFDVDTIKGILILLVIFAHLLIPYDKQENILGNIFFEINTFHMGAFFLISGYLSKNVAKERDNAFMSLFIPFIVFNSIIVLFNNYGSYNFLIPRGVYWYIFVLFIYRMMLPYIINCKYILIISFLLSPVMQLVISDGNMLAICRVFIMLPIFLIGFMLEEEIIDKIKKTSFILNVFLLMISVVTMLILHKIGVASLDYCYTHRYSQYKYFLLQFFNTWLIYIIVMTLFRIVPNKKLFFLTKIGKNSFLIYVLHRYVTDVIMGYAFGDTYPYVYLIFAIIVSLILACILGTDLLNNLYKKVVNIIGNMLNDSERKV